MLKIVAILTILGLFQPVLKAQQPPQTAASVSDRGVELLNQQKFPEAIEVFKEFVNLYKADALLDSVRLNFGMAYIFSQKYDLAVEQLKLCYDSRVAQAELKDAALFWIGEANFYQAVSFQAQDDKRKGALQKTIESMTKHITDFPESMYREDAYYRRAQSNALLENYDSVYKDVAQLIKEFPLSTSKGDYLLLKARSESLEVWRGISAGKKSKEEGLKMSEKPFRTLKDILDGTPSPVIANDARMQAGELQMLLSDEPEEYQKCIDLYRQVKTKQELIPIQEIRLKEIAAELAEAAKQRKEKRIRQLQLIRQKEQARLNDLKQSEDPMLEAMMKMATCYVRVKKPDEARVLLRRVSQFVSDAQKKEASYLTIMTYAMQPDRNGEAKKAFEAHQANFPKDDQADNISLMIGEELSKQRNFQGAYEQYQKSLQDYPKGRYAERASMKLAATLVQMNKPEEAVKTLQEFATKNPSSPLLAEALFSLGQAQVKLGKTDDALKTFKQVLDNPKAEAYGPNAILLCAKALVDAKRVDEAIQQFKLFLDKYPTHEQSPIVMLNMAFSTLQKGDVDSANKILSDILVKYPASEKAPEAATLLAQNLQRQGKVEEMIAGYERVVKDFSKSVKHVGNAHSNLARHYEKGGNFDKAETHYRALIELKQPDTAPWGYLNLAMMRFKAGASLGAYNALNEDEKKQWNSHIGAAEKACLELLRFWPDSKESGFALQELVKLAINKSKTGIYTEEQAEKYFIDVSKTFDNPNLKVRIELASAGIPYEKGDLARALKLFKAITSANPTAQMTADDINRYATALLRNKEYDDSIAMFKKLGETYPADQFAMANSIYGQGAAALFKGNVAEAAKFFEVLKKQYAWSEKIMEAELGLGLAAEEGKKFDDALTSYRLVIQSSKSTAELRAKATLGRGRIFQAQGMLIPDLTKKDQPSALAEYLKVLALFESEKVVVADAIKLTVQVADKAGVPQIISTQAPAALYSLAEVYDKDGRKAEAKTLYEAVVAKDPKSPMGNRSAEKLKTLK